MTRESNQVSLETERLRTRMATLLVCSDSPYVSGETLSTQTGLSRPAVWKHIQALIGYGFEVEALHGVGYRVTHAPNQVLEPLLAPCLPPDAELGRTVYWFETVDSTNRIAMELAAAGSPPHGAMVVGGRQTGGRGRRGRAWFAPAGGLWMSFILTRPLPLSRAAELTLLASVALRRAIRRVSSVEVKVKWPNDLLYEGRKLSGILAEIRADGEQVQRTVLGIGINTNIPAEDFPLELQNIATSILAASQTSVSHTVLCAAFISEFQPLYDDLVAGGPGFRAVAEEWQRESATLGNHVRIQTAAGLIEGTAVRLDESGILYVQTTDDQLRPVYSGDVLFS